MNPFELNEDIWHLKEKLHYAIVLFVQSNWIDRRFFFRNFLIGTVSQWELASFKKYKIHNADIHNDTEKRTYSRI